MSERQEQRKPKQERDGEMKELQALNEEENKERKWQQQKDQNQSGGY